ncbi:MAG: O-antigen ligase family protein [Ignavibacteria bacterium]|nr:O-antigen ligase family protein [Ignavibacteria bacterium]
MKESLKPGSTLGIRNFASEYLLASIPFAIFLILESRKNIFTLLSGFGLFVILTYTFLLRSRISYIILFIYIIFIIFFFLYHRKKTNIVFAKHKYVLLIIILIASFSLSFLPLSQIEPERKNVADASGSYLKYRYEPNFGRITFYDASIRLFLEKPVFGIGTNAFPGYYGKYQWDELGDRVVYNISFTHPHNEFLKVLSENGIFAFIIFSVIIFYPFIRLFKKIKLNIAAFPFFLCYTGVLINMLVAFPLSNVSLMILFTISAGYALIPYDKNEVIKKSHSGKILIIFLIIISVFSLYVNFIRYKSEIKYIEAMQMKFDNKYKEMTNILENIDKNIYPLDPNKMPLQYYLGIGYFEEGQYDKSLKCFNEAIQLMPYLPPIISNKATTLYIMGNIQEAEKTLLDLKSKFANYYEPQINLLALYMNSKRYDEAKILSNQIESDSTSKYAKNYNLLMLMQKELNLSR